MQIPAWQASDRVQAFASSQVVPFGFTGFEQTPVAGLHVPATWHESIALQTMGSAPTQTPD